jgi:hypothetical protein
MGAAEGSDADLLRFEIIPQSHEIKVGANEHNRVLLRAGQHRATNVAHEKIESLSRFALKSGALDALKHLPNLGHNRSDDA